MSFAECRGLHPLAASSYESDLAQHFLDDSVQRPKPAAIALSCSEKGHEQHLLCGASQNSIRKKEQNPYTAATGRPCFEKNRHLLHCCFRSWIGTGKDPSIQTVAIYVGRSCYVSCSTCWDAWDRSSGVYLFLRDLLYPGSAVSIMTVLRQHMRHDSALWSGVSVSGGKPYLEQR